MIITTVGIIGLVASHAIIGVLGWLFNTQISSIRSTKALKKIEAAQIELTRLRLPDQNLIPGELSTEEIPTVVMTSDQHFEYLKKQYPTAWKEYKDRHTDRPIIDRADRYILRLILAYENDQVQAELDNHTINFSNGDRIWIENKYYGYGRMYESKHNPGLCFDTTRTISPYTFLRIVDLEEHMAEPVLHLTPIKVENA
jgi:hypothetical protein